MRTLALVCYGWLAGQSGLLLWILWQIREHGAVILDEPNSWILTAELVMSGLVLMVAVGMFIRERLSR
jgi:hypothetical protein